MFLLIGCLTFVRAEERMQVSGVIEGKHLQLTPQLQQKLVEEAVTLLASCSNTVVQPKNTLENAKRKSHLHFVFTEPHSFDLGSERKPERTGVRVKEMVITLPLASGGTWIDSTRFRWYCSKYDTKIAQDMHEILKSAQ
jgi:hypothetical protein